MNAELLCHKGNERTAVKSWLEHHDINYDEEASTDELIELYRQAECGYFEKEEK